ncbi:MAG: enoyl-CoA hydratase/isomerase family protein [Deltaproteobacteria bacterium]|nr:enoyl-CoA hydratase/isomerase family protein [Deltaproteobacteria bacterium]
MALVELSTAAPHIRLLTLNEPETRNAISFDLTAELYRALDALHKDNDCSVVVLTGASGAFCSGMNLDEMGIPPNCEGLPMSRIAIRSMQYISGLIPAMRGIPQPIIGAINGAAYGGGLCLSLGADIRLASESASFCFAGVHHGLTGAEMGISYLLPRAVGSSNASEILLTGRRYGADDALRMGLVSQVHPDDTLLDRAIEMAKEIDAWSTHGISMTKRVLWSSPECGSLAAAIDLEDRNQMLVRMTTKNFEESMAARSESRKPEFKD